jgi:hypothetical protein
VSGGPTVLVDGHNALHALAASPPTDPDAALSLVVRRAAARAASRRGRPSAVRVHVVMDASPESPRAGGHGRDGAVSWSYARGSADDEIVRVVRLHDGKDGGAPIVVVTDDRELARRVAPLGAEVLGVAAWFEGGPARRGRREGGDEPPERRIEGPAMRPQDFGLPDAVDLDRADPDAL